MGRTITRVYRILELEESIAIAGFPGVGDVGSLVTKMLVNFLRADLIGELYSSNFQDFVFINKSGICHPPRYEFYVARKRRDLLIVTGDGYPAFEDIPGHYEICGDILNFLSKFGCKFIVVIDGVPAVTPQNGIFVAATSKRILPQIVERGASLYKNRKIVGLSGLILGLAERRGLEGLCILASTSRYDRDEKAAFRAYKFLMNLFKSDLLCRNSELLD